MNHKIRRRLRRIERRLDALETASAELPPAVTIPSKPVDTDRLWRATVADYATYVEYADADEWNHHGYL